MAKETAAKATAKPSVLVDTRVVYCGDNLEQLKKLPEACVDLIYIDPPFNSNRNYEVKEALDSSQIGVIHTDDICV
jgi:16S rRNA G966 N2-methylase RsmD